jgi:hypothetical protein
MGVLVMEVVGVVRVELASGEVAMDADGEGTSE